MKKFYFLCLLLLSFSITTQAQSANSSICIYLKDGNVLQAQLIRHSLTGGLQLVIADSVSLTLPYDVIEHIGSCKELKKEQAKEERPEKKLLTTGWYDALLISGLLGKDDIETLQVGLSAQYTKGYQWNEHFSAGAGFSADVYDRLFLSLLVETQGKLLSEGITPYYAIKGGYTIPTSSLKDSEIQIPAKGGLLLQPAIGLQFPGRKSSNFCLEIGFRWQKYQEEPQIWGFTDVVDRITYRRTVLSFGWRF